MKSRAKEGDHALRCDGGEGIDSSEKAKLGYAPRPVEVGLYEWLTDELAHLERAKPVS